MPRFLKSCLVCLLPACFLFASGLFASGLFAAELDATVVVVNGETISLGQLETELLRKEGVEEAQDLINRHLERLDWSKMQDGDAIIEIGGQKVTRLDLAAHLLREHGSEVRKELINITLVRQALAKSGIILDQALLKIEFDRQERQFAQKMAESGQTQVVFADYLKVKEGKTVREWMAEDGFRMAAALHELVHRDSRIPDDLLKPFFKERYEELYARPEGLRLSVITRSWPMVKLGQQEVVDAGRKEGTMATMRELGQRIQAGKMSFEQAWQLWGKPYDPNSTDGDVGWIGRDGSSERMGARSIPKDVMELAWGVEFKGQPLLLPPVAHATGIDLVRIEARREATRPEFAEVRDQVHRDYVEAHLEPLTHAFMERLALEAEVEYQSLSALTESRIKQAGLAPAAEEPAE